MISPLPVVYVIGKVTRCMLGRILPIIAQRLHLQHISKLWAGVPIYRRAFDIKVLAVIQVAHQYEWLILKEQIPVLDLYTDWIR